MAAVLRWHQGVDGPSPPVTLSSGAPGATLAGATVRLTAEPMAGGTPLIDGAVCEVLDPDAMAVRYNRTAGDVANDGRWRAWFVATYSDGSQQVFPERGYALIIVEPELGAT